ncbi:MAG: PAS domain S-box protein, partial [Desulfuromonadaceae bacterium]|nr:PAS domain S-box protein [Desulfuromonadaceae bacterium]
MIDSFKSSFTKLSCSAYLFRLVAIVLLLDLFVFTLAAMLLFQNRIRFQERATNAAQNLSQVLEQNISSTINKCDLALLTTSIEAEQQLATGSIDMMALNAYIARLYSQQPDLDSLRVADRQGTILYGINVKPGARISIADRDFFTRLRDDPKTGLVISKPVVGRISGKWVIILARRLNNTKGNFAGVVYAAITLEHFKKMFAALDLGSRGAISIRELDLSLVVRYPEPSGGGSSIGSKTVSNEFMEALRSHPDFGNFIAPTWLDQINRINFYRRISTYPGYVIVGLATEDYLAGWRNEALKILLLVTLFVLTTLVASSLSYRAWKRQKDSLEKLEESERKYQLLFENMTTGFALHEMVYDDLGSPVDYRFLEVNPAFEKLMGVTASSIIGKSVKEVMPNTELFMIEQYGIVARAGAPLSYQNYSQGSGKSYDVSVFSPGKDLFAVIIADITRSLETLRETEEWNSTILNAAVDGIVTIDEECVIISANAATEKIFGYSLAELLGVNVDILMPEPFHSEHDSYVQNYVITGHSRIIGIG